METCTCTEKPKETCEVHGFYCAPIVKVHCNECFRVSFVKETAMGEVYCAFCGEDAIRD